MYAKFLVEGDKTVRELLSSRFTTKTVFATSVWFAENSRLLSSVECVEVSKGELRKISQHENPNGAIAVAEMVSLQLPDVLNKGLFLVLDNISDPGNMGTIIRTADWFGVQGVILSETCVEIYNPKVVSAAKGSLFRMPCYITSLHSFFVTNPNLNSYGAVLSGKNLYTTAIPKDAVIVIGNEANGISDTLLPYLKCLITIPSYGPAESLNAGVATAVILSQIRSNEL